MVYVRDGIFYRFRIDIGVLLFEFCVIEIFRFKCKKLIIWIIYRAFDINFEIFIEDLNRFLFFLVDKSEFVLFGDFNVNFIDIKMNNDKVKKRKFFKVINFYYLD